MISLMMSLTLAPAGPGGPRGPGNPVDPFENNEIMTSNNVTNFSKSKFRMSYIAMMKLSRHHDVNKVIIHQVPLWWKIFK